MRHILTLLLVCLGYAEAYSSRPQAFCYVPEPLTWTTQSPNSSASMPCGGHDIGMNVWVENGDLLFYLSRSGYFDENNTLLKAGRFRLHIDGNPFSRDFSQTLSLVEGCIYIKGGGVSVRLWADVNSPMVYMTTESKTRHAATLSYESWRYRDRTVTKAECQQGSWKWLIKPDCTTYADNIKPSQSAITFTHTNRQQTVYDFTVSYEGLDSIRDQIPDPIGGLSFGGTMIAPGFTYAGTSDGIYASTDYRAWNYRTTDISDRTIAVCCQPQAGSLTATALASMAKASRTASAQWWLAYWQRSFIQTDAPEAKTMVRNYELFRYMLGCNAHGQWPTKFNGGLFTFDPEYADSASTFTPDYRRWGGGTMTAQNQRLVYWPMLKSGDVDMMRSQFDTYLRMLPAATARTRFCWGHDGASFTEQIENFGLPNPAEWGKHPAGTDLGTDRNRWLEHLWDTSLEFCQMILLAHQYSGLDITPYEELIRQSLVFFDEHYQYMARQHGVRPLDEAGKLVIYPGSGCETYKMAYNPSSTVAGLRTVLETWGRDTAMLSRIPDIPYTVIDGDSCIAPAAAWMRIQNVETPQLYPVFPWRMFGVGRPHLDIARNTYFKDPHAQKMRSHTGWKQDNIWAACLGLTDEARRLNLLKLSDGPFRFPAFWDKGFDWAPDCNRGGAGMIGLQEMLLQETPDGKPILFPAWPREWNCHFRLHATGGRTIDAELRDGEIIY